jgi:hypothetical protein
MSRKDQLAGTDPFAGGDESPEENASLSVVDADTALFGELARLDAGRQVVKPISIFGIYPDVQQPRRAVPFQVRKDWSGEPRDIADMFNTWLDLIRKERAKAGRAPFNLDDYLWSESVQRKQRSEDDLAHLSETNRTGAIETSFLKVVELAVSIRRDGLANPVTLERLKRDAFRLETGERRWLAFHILYGYFNGENGKPQERDRWEKIPANVVESFSVWRQASENTARADLNAIGRARQFAILMIDLLKETDADFQPYHAIVKPGKSDRPYYAQVIEHRVPKGKGEMLANGLGVSHRAAFSRCRLLLGLPDEVWTIGDEMNLSEDDLLRLAKLEPPELAIQEAREIAGIVASRNIPDSNENRRSGKKPPTLFTDPACYRGKRLFSRQNELVAKELLSMCDGVGQAGQAAKQQIRDQIGEMKSWLKSLENAVNGG